MCKRQVGMPICDNSSFCPILPPSQLSGTETTDLTDVFVYHGTFKVVEPFTSDQSAIEAIQTGAEIIGRPASLSYNHQGFPRHEMKSKSSTGKQRLWPPNEARTGKPKVKLAREHIRLMFSVGNANLANVNSGLGQNDNFMVTITAKVKRFSRDMSYGVC